MSRKMLFAAPRTAFSNCLRCPEVVFAAVTLVVLSGCDVDNDKCTIHFQERIRVVCPVPQALMILSPKSMLVWSAIVRTCTTVLPAKELSEVLYIDHNHFHMTGEPDSRIGSPY